MLGMDVHRDTPVEILHTILLGVLKYFWRDVTVRLDKCGKAMLQVRLDSYDARGLHADLSKLNGKTLVQYSHSLVGRDFRHVVQVASLDKRRWKSLLLLLEFQAERRSRGRLRDTSWRGSGSRSLSYVRGYGA